MDAVGPPLHGQHHRQPHAPWWNQGPAKAMLRYSASAPVLPGLLTPSTYLYPGVIKSGTQYNLINGLCVWGGVHSHQSRDSHCLSPILFQESHLADLWYSFVMGTRSQELHGHRVSAAGARSPELLSRARADQPCHVARAGVGWAPLHNGAWLSPAHFEWKIRHLF